jgi:hypothetical protein
MQWYMTSSVPIEWPGAPARGATSDIGRDRRHGNAARSFENHVGRSEGRGTRSGAFDEDP